MQSLRIRTDSLVGSDKENLYPNYRTRYSAKTCICCMYEIHTTDLILKAGKTVTNTMYRKKKPASSKQIPERLFQKVNEIRGVPDESESPTKSVATRV